MAPDKSLAAEIEAIIDRAKSYDTPRADDPRRRYTQAQMEIAVRAALQSRTLEDGARWMRERAADRVKDRAYLMEHGEEQAAVLRAASDLAALPLQPEGERNV